MTNWEGLPDTTEHRTVGEHRAWCYQDVEWCYPGQLCRCCDQTKVPLEWRHWKVGDVLEDLRTKVEALDHSWDCEADKPAKAGMPCDCPIKAVLALLDGNSYD